MPVTRAPLPEAPKRLFLSLAEGFLSPSIQSAGRGRAAYSSLRPFGSVEFELLQILQGRHRENGLVLLKPRADCIEKPMGAYQFLTQVPPLD